MHFLPDVYVRCETCKGKRYNDSTLRVTFRGNSIADVLDLSVRDAVGLFENVPPILRILTTLDEVGLGYVALGQPATTLSGGEAQRVKLAKELARRDTGRTLYVLDEPTTGLHFEDVKRLLAVLQRLVDAGNSVLVIEHQLDVIASADWIVDMGPEGGAAGGRLVAEGTPERVAKVAGSYTGRFLAPLIAGRPSAAQRQRVASRPAARRRTSGQAVSET
jgi:excinuclease ABC subunit A